MAPSRGSDDVTVPTKVVQTLTHPAPVNVVRYNHGAKYVLTGGADRAIRLWNPATAKEIKKYEGHGREVLALDISHDNARFASCGGDKMVLVWDVATGNVLRRLQGHFGRINAVAFNADAQVLATAGFDAKVMLWDMRAVAREPMQTLKDATSSITSVALPGSIPSITAASSDGHVRTHDLRLGKTIDDLLGPAVLCALPSKQNPRESYLAMTAEGKLRIMDNGNGGCLQTVQIEGWTGDKGGAGGGTSGRGAGRCEWGYGEASVLAGDEEGRVWAWNVLTAKPLDASPPKEHKKAVTWLEMNPNGKEMITSSLDGTVKVWQKP